MKCEYCINGKNPGIKIFNSKNVDLSAISDAIWRLDISNSYCSKTFNVAAADVYIFNSNYQD